jgi:Holliday junction DNA helicase RuvA
VSGVGYRVVAPTSLTGQVNVGDRDVTVFTSAQVTDSLMALYGFASVDDRDVFELLITVSGVGPKAAVKMLGMNREQLVDAIGNEDAKMIATVPGIGPKTARRVILELKDKVGKLYGTAVGAGGVSLPSIAAGNLETAAAVQGLQALGYNNTEIKYMLDRVGDDDLENLDAAQIIQLCLKKKD